VAEQNQAPLAAVEVARRDSVELGVYPVQPLGYQVQGDAVRPFHVERGNHFPMSAIHAGPFDLCVAAPVTPIQPPVSERAFVLH